MKSFFSVLFGLFILFPLFCQENELSEANQYYEQGIKATRAIDRKIAFNRALLLYHHLEEKFQPNESSALYEALGDTYFQLEEYAWSIFYYYKGLELTPRSPRLEAELILAQKQLDLPQGREQSAVSKLLSFNHYLSYNERKVLFFMMGVVTIFAFLFFILVKKNGLKLVAYSTFGITALLFFNIIFTLYFTPIEAILVQPTGLFFDPKNPTEQLLPMPLSSGLKVYVIDVLENGTWLKIDDKAGKIGYVPSVTLRIIN